ncbi:MAG: hypothetical protein VYA34_13135 [Myxococcota bacterium]|nr:hypothetical protein [Myxococcota bacterium]
MAENNSGRIEARISGSCRGFNRTNPERIAELERRRVAAQQTQKGEPTRKFSALVKGVPGPENTSGQDVSSLEADSTDGEEGRPRVLISNHSPAQLNRLGAKTSKKSVLLKG